MTSGSMPAAHNLVSVLTTLVFSAGFWTGAGAADADPFSSYREMLARTIRPSWRWRAGKSCGRRHADPPV